MKKNILAVLLLILMISVASGQGKKSALLIIDIRDFYFPGGKSELVDPAEAAGNAVLLLERFRHKNLEVIYSTLSTLKSYALVESTADYLAGK